MSSKSYSSVEIVVSRVSNVLGDFTEETIAPRGTTLASVRSKPRLASKTSKTEKCCLANYVPGLAEATTVVHIPATTVKGDPLTADETQQAFWFACEKYGVPLWTQSGIKNRTFEFVMPEMAEKLMSAWNLGKDGARFAAYAGLLYSEMDGTEAIVFDNARTVSPDDGQDGNCLWGLDTSQFRAMTIGENGIPTSLLKGIGVHHADHDTPMAVNTTQVKFGNGVGSVILLRNKYVGCKRMRMYVSAEPILMLRDNEFVRNYLAQNTKMEVSKLLSLLTEDRRDDLLVYLGSLHLDESGTLQSSKRAVEEALRSNLPWCKEIEERITRFAIGMIVNKIIPSGGLKAVANLMVVSDKYGVDTCEWQFAKAVAFRIPVTGSNAIIPLPKDPFVRGKGNVVTSNVAKLASGDADGDILAIITDPEIVELFRVHLNRELVSGLKPEKEKANIELNADTLTDIALRQMSNAWIVGGLSVAGWKMIQIGDYESASQLLDMANIEPMTYKHSITFDGVQFHAIALRLYSKLRKQLAEIHLNWREAAQEAASWKSPREMVDALVVVNSHLDACWNAGVEAALEWDAKNPLKPLSLSAVARIAFGERGQVISGSDWREAREMIKDWGLYWKDWHENGSNPNVDHSEMFHKAVMWARKASAGAIAAMLVWRPQSAESTGFGLKWHTVFAGGRAVEVLGYNHRVAERIKDLRSRAQDMQHRLALVEAVIKNIE